MELARLATDETLQAPAPRSPGSPREGAGIRLDSSAVAPGPLLRERLRIYGKIGCLLSVVFWLVVHGLGGLGVGLSALAHAIVLGVAAVYGLVWAAAVRLAVSTPTLQRLELLGTVVVCLQCALFGWLAGDTPGFQLNAPLTLTNVLVFRAVMIPGSPRRTAGVGVLSALPVVVPALAPAQFGLDVAPLDAGLVAGWAAVAVAVSTVVSHVVHGLREEVREARHLGQYRLEERIGSGGSGEVWRATHAMLARPAAVKLIRPELVDEASLGRFEREVRLASRLSHPNTVQVYDYGRAGDGRFYYAMELLPGLDLYEVVRLTGPLPPGRVIHVLRQICGSLAEAHSQGLVHRDIKAANVLLCERGGVADVAKVVDFGLARKVAAEEDERITVTRAGAIAGTAWYLSPEAISDSAAVDAASDLYAVGVLGWFLLVGHHPFDAESLAEVCAGHLFTPAPAPSEHLGAALPGDLESAVLACLAKDPAARPASAEALDRALAACADAGAWTRADASAWWERHRPGQRSEYADGGDTQVDELASTLIVPGQAGGED